MIVVTVRAYMLIADDADTGDTSHVVGWDPIWPLYPGRHTHALCGACCELGGLRPVHGHVIDVDCEVCVLLFRQAQCRTAGDGRRN